MAEIDADGWLTIHTRLTEKVQAGSVEAIIVLQQQGAHGPNQSLMMECIRELRKLGPIADLADPMAWQRSIREDRTLRHGN